MIHAGEAGDRVADVLDKIGYNAEIEVEEKLKTLTSLIEPVIIMIIGIFIGFVVLAIMLPIFQINQIFWWTESYCILELFLLKWLY